MNDFANARSSGGMNVKLWRGERMCLVGMNIDDPADDMVGFAIEVKGPGDSDYEVLNNRLAFSYNEQIGHAVTGARDYPSLKAPFQKFRWVHFPHDPKDGKYTYRVTQMHMPQDDRLVNGASITLDISLDRMIYNDFLEVGFTRNFASSQAYNDRYKGSPAIIPARTSAKSLDFDKVPGDVYEWLGFEAYELLMGILKEVAADKTLSLDVFAYDLDERDFVANLEKLGSRLRIIVDNSGTHGGAGSGETAATKRLTKSAGKANVKRMHFANLQHNKVLIVKKNGTPLKVLFGSTNFSFRGLYIQANNALVVHAPEAAQQFEKVFQLAFDNASPTSGVVKWFTGDAMSQKWYTIKLAGKPVLQFCFSPHGDTDLSLKPIGDAITNAKSSVFYSIAFLSQIQAGPVRQAIDKLMKKPLFSYGISDKKGGLTIKKPDGSLGSVSFAYLNKVTPKPFNAEWSGGAGIHQHDKYVVTDFNLPSATVFTGSSNHAPSGEKGNGDNLVMIKDQKVATSYAIESLRVFDHLHFRMRMQNATTTKGGKGKKKTDKQAEKALTLKKPKAVSGQDNWFASYYAKGSQAASDRLLFSK